MSVTTSTSLTKGAYGSSRVGLKGVVSVKSGAKKSKKPYSRPPGSKGPWKHPPAKITTVPAKVKTARSKITTTPAKVKTTRKGK